MYYIILILYIELGLHTWMVDHWTTGPVFTIIYYLDNIIYVLILYTHIIQILIYVILTQSSIWGEHEHNLINDNVSFPVT